jgi:radical SAM-linked protein
VKFHSPETSALEGVFSRGDDRLPGVIARAFRNGARFDAWTEAFRPDAWKRAFEEEGVDPLEYLRERDPRDPLPWEFVDAGIDREFLLSEREKARAGETTPDCRAAGCSPCGACPPGLSNITYPGRLGEPAVADEEIERAPHPAAAAAQRHVVRLSYAKEGPAKYLSGLEIQSLWGRVFRRAGLPLAYSQGFNPSPKLSLSPALAVGAESDVEFLEAEFTLPVPAADVPVKLAPHLPAGIRVTFASGVPPGSPRLSDFDIASDWSLRPLPPFPLPEEVTPGRAEERLAAFHASDRHPLVLTREDRTSEIDLKPIVRTFGVNPDGISITIIQGTGKGVRPVEAAASLLGVPLSPERFIPRKVSAELIPRRG